MTETPCVSASRFLQPRSVSVSPASHSSMKEPKLGPLALLMLFNLFITFSSGLSDGVCTSQGGRFPAFSLEGKPPKQASKGHRDLNLCRVFRKKTCCDVAQTHPALLSIRKLASSGEASQECLQLWELLECAICDPLVGVHPGLPLICASFCDRVFQACSDAYFSIDAKTQVLAPCGVNDFVCGRASGWVSNGTELCSAAGFSVQELDEDTSCYGGKASLELISDTWRNSVLEKPRKTENSGSFEDFQQWLEEIAFNERVSWAVGGMVLTAGLLLISKRKSYNQRQRLAVIQRAAKKLEAKMNEKSPAGQGSRRVGRR